MQGAGIVNSDNKKKFSDALFILKIRDHEFNKIRELVHDHFGINLSNEKKMLVVGRLQKYLKENGFESFKDYLIFLESDQTGKALSDLINRISTNYTYFFREKEHFNFLNSVALPEIVGKHRAADSRDLRIWSAGCSAGDEAYSLVITMKEFLGTEYNEWDAGLLATDISATVLNEAKKGLYTRKRLGELNNVTIGKYFIDNKNNMFQLKSDILDEVTFRRFNLINDNFPFKKKFEVISCRNVMIYFDSQTREELVNKLYDFTVDGGYLFIGHSETLNKKKCAYNFIQPGIYRKGGENV